DCVREGHGFVSFEQTASEVIARFRRSDGSMVEVPGDVLVGADGIHSMVRAQLHPNDGGMLWNGTMMWRGTVDWPTFDGGDTMIVSGDMKEKILYYPIAKGTKPGTMLTNWVLCGEVSKGISPPPERESWSRRGTMERAYPFAKNFKLPDLNVLDLIEATPEFFEYPMCDREPLTAWGTGRVTLLGDAAHPMYPVGSNGAAQSILDARCLADELARSEHPRQALLAYEQKRLPMTAEVVRSNRRGGPEGVIDAVEQIAPDGFTDIDKVLSYSQREAIVRGYATKAGFAAVPGLAAVRA